MEDTSNANDIAAIKCSYDDLIEPHKLVEHPKNPNKHPEKQIDRLAKIIDYQGMRSPIVVSLKSGFITKGHGRLAALKKLGWKKVPVDYQEYDDEAQEYADIVADNAIAEWASLEFQQINSDFIDLGPELDVEMLGFKDFEIEPIDKLDPQADEDEFPEAPDEPIAKRGDVWRLGRHRLMCGDGTMIDDVEKLMGGKKADMVFTDPPYNTGMKESRQKEKAWLSHMFNDSYSKDHWERFMADFCSTYYSQMKDNSVAYICLDWRRNHELVPHIKNNFKLSNIIIWDKVVHGLGSDYKYTYELINVCKKGKPELRTHQGEREYSDVWHIQRKMGKNKDHATAKPVELVERCVRHASKPHELVVDFFLGSGTTLIASEKHNRVCYGMELEPKYCDVIIKRWEDYTGKKAVLNE